VPLIINPFVFICLIPLDIFIFRFQVDFSRTACDLKKLENACQKAILIEAESSSQGILTIRSSNKSDLLAQEFAQHLGYRASASFASLFIHRWFDLWLNLLSLIYLSGTLFACILLKGNNRWYKYDNFIFFKSLNFKINICIRLFELDFCKNVSSGDLLISSVCFD
jgi:hypothetical protein